MQMDFVLKENAKSVAMFLKNLQGKSVEEKFLKVAKIQFVGLALMFLKEVKCAV